VGYEGGRYIELVSTGGKETAVSGFGHWQRIILEYAAMVSKPFTAAEVLAYWLEKQGVHSIDRESRHRLLRRIHDALQRLVKRGILVKVKRGLYAVLKQVPIVSTSRKVETSRKRCGRGCGGGCGVVFRWHVRVGVGGVGGVVSVLFVRAYFMLLWFRWVVGVLGRLLRRLGFGRCRLARLRGVARRLFGVVVRGRVRVGVHGWYPPGSSNRPIEEFVPLERLVEKLGGLPVRAVEAGVDVYSSVSDGERELLEEWLGFGKFYWKQLGVMLELSATSSANSDSRTVTPGVTIALVSTWIHITCNSCGVVWRCRVSVWFLCTVVRVSPHQVTVARLLHQLAKVGVEVIVGLKARLVVLNGKYYLDFGGLKIPVDLEDSGSLSISIDEGMLEKYRSWLQSGHRRKPVRDRETVAKYVNCIKRFMECSGGVISPETIARCVSNKHFVRALRAYIEMLVFYGHVGVEAQALLDRLRWREETSIAEDEVSLSQVLLSIGRCLSRCREDYRTIYIALYYTGGVRLEQLVNALPLEKRRWRLLSEHPRPYGRYNAVSVSSGTKSTYYWWMPLDVFEALSFKPPTPSAARKYYSRHRLLTPTLIRSFCWQAAKYILGEDLARMLQGRLGELKLHVTATSYDNLRYQLDKMYPKWMQFIDDLVSASTEDNRVSIAKKLIDKYNLLMPP